MKPEPFCCQSTRGSPEGFGTTDLRAAKALLDELPGVTHTLISDPVRPRVTRRMVVTVRRG